uniref:Uncharacterized protein n=1 Tax=Anguilla anguilla TaxID=7936 RepID=A0A0E9V6W4_ANGAN
MIACNFIRMKKELVHSFFTSCQLLSCPPPAMSEVHKYC